MLCFGIAIFVNRASTPKIFCSEVQVIFWGSSRIWPFLGSGTTEVQLSLILVRNQRSSSHTSISQRYGDWTYFGSGNNGCRNGHFSEQSVAKNFTKMTKNRFFPVLTPIFFTSPFITSENLLVSFCALCPPMLGTWRQIVCLPKIGPKRRILAKNSIFCF